MPERPSFNPEITPPENLPTRRVEDTTLPPKPEPETPQEKTEQQKMLQEAQELFGQFHERYGQLINGYFGTPDIQFQCKGRGWYIDLENIKVNADPTFFIEKGYTEPEALFATFHEAEHFRDMARDPQAYKESFARFKRQRGVHPQYGPTLARLYNCLDDVLVNRAVMARWRAGSKAKDALYPKLFPSTDLRGDPQHPQPRHRQFMYALLREAMLPKEKCEVDSDVRAAIEKWQARGGHRRAIDVLTDVDARGNAKFTAKKRFEQIALTVEPIFKKFFLDDLKDRIQPTEEVEEQEIFPADPFTDAIPDPIAYDKVLNDIDALKKGSRAKAEKQLEDALGVSREDYDAYKEDYDVVEPYVEELSDVFENVVQRRVSTRRILGKPVKEGPMLDPRKAAIAAAEIAGGQTEPTIFLDYRTKETVREQPEALEFTLVCDGSGSMGGDRQNMQRHVAVLVTEAFAKFERKIESRLAVGEPVNLSIKSEVRIFSDDDQVVKPLTDKLEHVDRVRMRKALSNLPGGGTAETPTLNAMREEQFKGERLRKLQEGELKKVILFLTDGGSGEPDRTRAAIKNLYRLAGETNEGKSSLIVGGIGFEGGQDAVRLYAPNGYYAARLDQVAEYVQRFIEKIVEDI